MCSGSGRHGREAVAVCSRSRLLSVHFPESRISDRTRTLIALLRRSVVRPGWTATGMPSLGMASSGADRSRRIGSGLHPQRLQLFAACPSEIGEWIGILSLHELGPDLFKGKIRRGVRIDYEGD